MRIISIILTLILIIAWGYTSWYWYVCHIKGLCDSVIKTQNITQESSTNTQEQVQLRTIGDFAVTSDDGENTEENQEIEQEIFSDPFAMSETYCQNPLSGKIELEGNNDPENVRKLEAFLMARGEDVTIDGVYDEDDFEAVKRFQREYKDEILIPWNIEAPTGVVFTTTVQKINEIACP